MQISIIIPCYNQEQYLEKCLQSIIQQTYTDWECILVDDGSTDQTAQIANKWSQNDSRFSYFYKENGGLSSARNYGIKKAKGEYILFVDSDDALANNEVLFSMTKHLKPETDVLSANVLIEYANGEIEKSTLNNYFNTPKTFKNLEILNAFLNEDISVVAWNKLYSKKFIEKWDLSFIDGLLHEDELWSLEVFLRAEQVITIPDFTYLYFKGNPQSITATKNINNYNSQVYNIKGIISFYEKEEKMQRIEKRKIIRAIEKNYYFLKRPDLIRNKKMWIEKYSEIQKIYKKTDLYSIQSRFLFPARLTHFATKKIYVDQTTGVFKKILTPFIRF